MLKICESQKVKWNLPFAASLIFFLLSHSFFARKHVDDPHCKAVISVSKSDKMAGTHFESHWKLHELWGFYSMQVFCTFIVSSDCCVEGACIDICWLILHHCCLIHARNYYNEQIHLMCPTYNPSWFLRSSNDIQVKECHLSFWGTFDSIAVRTAQLRFFIVIGFRRWHFKCLSSCQARPEMTIQGVSMVWWCMQQWYQILVLVTQHRTQWSRRLVPSVTEGRALPVLNTHQYGPGCQWAGEQALQLQHP